MNYHVHCQIKDAGNYNTYTNGLMCECECVCMCVCVCDTSCSSTAMKLCVSFSLHTTRICLVRS